MTTSTATPVPAATVSGDLPGHVHVAIVGTGFAGLGAAIKLKQDGVDDIVLLERAGDLGGTWRDNTYPGCRCDIPSLLYSFSFDQNPDWSATYSPQDEIWEYLRRSSERFGVTPHVRYNAEVIGADWDDDNNRWTVETVRGTLTADFLIGAMGGLSEPSVPQLPGLERFEGTTFHSAQWNHDYDLKGKKVAVIGTGASAIQFVPEIQPDVEKLDLFQRTPPWIMPAGARPLMGVEHKIYKRFPALQRLTRARIYWGLEALVVGLAFRPRLLKAMEFIGRRHLELQVRDPELRRKVTPDYRIGCKRILRSNNYYPALGKRNVDVVTAGIREITPHGVVTEDGVEHEADTIIFGTGFKVLDLPIGDRVRGRGGKLLRDLWDGAPEAYLGTTIAGMPNLFVLVGPNTGLGHNSIIYMIESQVRYVVDAIRTARKQSIAAVEVRREVQDAFNAELQEKMDGTVWTAGGCKSWYIDEDGRNFTLWPRFTFEYRNRTQAFDPEHYMLTPRAPAREDSPVAV